MKSKNLQCAHMLLRTAIVVAAAGSLVSTEVLAQDDPTRLDTIEVTGSRIKRVQAEGPAPVTVITADDIDKLGYTTVADILGGLTVNSGGTFDTGTSFLFARGTASIDLRGFGAGRTLVLMDGRRLPVHPQGLGGTDQFVDLSTIPAAMIERVEVLLDGASAVYGSDAISGVVNIITRRKFTGSYVSGRFSGTDDGGGAAQRYEFMQGFQAGDTSVQLVAEYTHQNVLKFTDRSYSSSDFNNGGNGSSFGSTFFADDGQVIADPNCAANSAQGFRLVGAVCRFDRSTYRQWVPESDKGSLYVRADRKFGDLDGFVRLGYYRGDQRFELEPNPFSGGESSAFTSDRIIPDSAFDPVNGPGYVAAGAPNNPTTGTAQESGGFFFRRLVEFGPRGGEITTESYNGIVGLAGAFGAYTWDAAITVNDVRLASYTPTVLSSVFDNEVSNNGLDLFQPIPASVLLKASHLQVERAFSRNQSIDGTVSGPVGFDLPGGMIQFAVHGIYEDQEYKDEFDPISTSGDVFDGGSGGGGDRSYAGIGVEFNLPVIDMVELSVAGRYDSYDDQSDTGNSFSPSLRVGVRPMDTLLLRASWGESFRAPDLQRLFGSTTAGFNNVIDTPRCLAAGGTPGTPVNPADPDDPCREIQSVPGIDGANPNLEEEKGENYNLGVVWEITNGLTATVDYYNIEVDDIVSSLSAQQILDLCATQGSFCGQITRAPDGTLGTPSRGGDNRAVIRSGAQNLSTQKIDGIDLKLNYEFTAGPYGRFNTGFNWSRILSLKVRSLDGQPMVEQIDFGETVVAPEDRFALTGDWGLDIWGATVRIDRIGKYPGAQVGLTATSDEFVDAFTTVNVQGRADFGVWGLVRLGIENLFNEEFSKDPTFRPGTPGVQNQYIIGNPVLFSDPFGRTAYLQYELHF